MKQLYDKNKLWFTLMWIGAYVVLLSLADSVSSALGTEKLLSAPLCAALCMLLFLWLKKHNLAAYYGLTKANFPTKTYLHFLPLAAVVSVNLWGGLAINLSLAETLLYIISMLCVGFLEEVIFRGFLFKALCKDSIKQAIFISSLTFGLGHIVNLLNGAAFLATLLQIIYAVSIGYLFTIIFYKSGSLLPCIAAHSLVNALSVFSPAPALTVQIITALFLTVVPLLYACWIQKNT